MKSPTITLDSLKALVSPHPTRDWLLVLGLAFLLTLALIVYAVYLYIGISSGSVIGKGSDTAQPVATVSREALNNVVSLYETRKLNYDSGNIRLPKTPDPSR